mmetsp:Transcript_14454/g.29646  ORF Transcript_14454/g.29646 Transcript_14454/m.29646 type:complete len:131 (+) Transcript_14454:676-1068(+)
MPLSRPLLRSSKSRETVCCFSFLSLQINRKTERPKVRDNSGVEVEVDPLRDPLAIIAAAKQAPRAGSAMQLKSDAGHSKEREQRSKCQVRVVCLVLVWAKWKLGVRCFVEFFGLWVIWWRCRILRGGFQF